MIEVSESTLRFDRGVNVPLYAAAGIREVWITDIKEQRVICFSDLREGRYQLVAHVLRGERLVSAYDPLIALNTNEILR